MNKIKVFRLLNPNNLEKQVSMYGYQFSWKRHAVLIMASLLGITTVGLLFQLQPSFMIVTIIAVLLALPVLIVSAYKRMFEQKRFADVTTYMQQMLYSYQKSGKILASLNETSELFEKGMMKEVIDKASMHLTRGKADTEKGVLAETLAMIEDVYSCIKIHTLHELLISSEEQGGEVKDSIFILLEDVDDWKKRSYLLQEKKKKSHTDNIVSIVVATLLCATALYVLDGMGKLFPSAAVEQSIFAVPAIQLSSLIFILLMLQVLIKSFSMMTSNWLNEESMYAEDYIEKSYERFVNDSFDKEKKKSLIWAAPFFIVAVLAFLYHHTWIGAGCIMLSIFMLFQHRIGRSIARKDVTSEMRLRLPEWLMEMALLLQNNNVQVSIRKSIDTAPVVLRQELIKLSERLSAAPDKLTSYTEFCAGFDVPEIQNCMKMLHAISESGTGDANVQIRNLIRQTNELQNEADELRNKSLAFKVKMIFSYPVAAATVKLLVDMTIGMVFMFAMLGNVGGM